MNPTLEHIAKAATELGYTTSYPQNLPSCEFLYLHDGNKKFLINKTKSPFLPSVKAKLVTDKYLSGEMMRAAGLPTAPKRLVTEFGNEDIEFLKLYKEVIVKPNSMDRGVGVVDCIRDVTTLKRAFEGARRFGSVVIEKQVVGREYRILVINGKAVAALERRPVFLKGDGESTVQELIAKLNQDSRRGSVNDRKTMRPIVKNLTLQTRLSSLGLTMDSILGLNQVQKISFSNHLDSGGMAIDCTEFAHPENLKICERAAKLFAIDVAGIDLICRDITQKIDETGDAAILEVNPGPDILWHMYPTKGDPQPVAQLFVQYVLTATN